MSPLIAFCGIDCAQCEAYQATQADDLAWKERVAAQWREEYQAPNINVTSVTCDGCTSKSGRWCSHCYECELRACGRSRGLESCAACPDYACEKLERFFILVPPARANLEALRSA
jgi:hypothetical protein